MLFLRISLTSSIYFLGTPESVIINTLPFVFNGVKRFTFVKAFFAITTLYWVAPLPTLITLAIILN